MFSMNVGLDDARIICLALDIGDDGLRGIGSSCDFNFFDFFPERCGVGDRVLCDALNGVVIRGGDISFFCGRA